MKQIFLGISALTFCGFALLPSLGQGQEAADQTFNPSNNASVPGELLVQFKAEATPNDKVRAYGRIKAHAFQTLIQGKAISIQGKAISRTGNLVLVKHRPDLPPQAAIKALAQDSSVAYVEPNWIYTHQATSNDPYYTNGSLWGMYSNTTSPANNFGSQANKAWAAGHTGSNTVYVGVIDEGLQVGHTDLRDNVWTNPYDPVDGIDNDGNGYIDDTNGWDFAGNNNSVYDGTADNHGTHVAGTIGAKGANGTGVAGVNWNVKLISAKFLGLSSGTTANAIKAIDYITDLKTRHGLNIVATNNSWGGGGYSKALQDAIERANKANILFVAAAGNGGSDKIGDNNDITANYPSNYPNENVIAVAAITNNGSKSSFSNYGATKVDIGAPGSSIWSTVPGSSNSSIYGSYNGTSMATPHVTGAVALYASIYPGATASQIKNAILSTAVPTTSLAGLTVTGGRLNVFSAISQPPIP